jgi:hypothetical protein
MTITYHTFYTDNIPDYVVNTHKEICKKFNIQVNYHVEKFKPPYTTGKETGVYPAYAQHGEYMDDILKSSKDDIVGFLDIDCLPTNKYTFKSVENYIKNTKTFCGNAQNISHTRLKNVIYAAASYLVIHRNFWKDCGEPSMRYRIEEDMTQIDTAMDLTIRANQMGANYQLLLPTGFDINDENGNIQLGPYGIYGKGCHYPCTWHLMRISELFNNKDIEEIWMKIGKSILDNTYSPIAKYKFYPYRVLGIL